MEKPNRVTTVGQLRAALEGVPDGTPLIVNAADRTDPEFVDEQVITSTGFGSVDWGDGYGLERDSVFALNCDASMAIEDARRKPIRPARHPGAEASPAAGCRTCGATTELEKVTWHSPGDSTSRDEWFCVDRRACNERRFPGLAELLSAGWPGETPEPEAES